MDMKICYGPEYDYQKKNLEEIIIPNGVESFRNKAFSNCKKLKRVVLPSTIKDLGSYTFCYCLSLREIKIPTNIEEIPMGCFLGCENLVKVVLPMKLKRINRYAFSQCSSLSYVVLPPMVCEISCTCFLDCNNPTIYGNNVRERCNDMELNKPYMLKSMAHTLKSYNKKDLEDFIVAFENDLQETFSKKEIVEILQDEFYNLSFIKEE